MLKTSLYFIILLLSALSPAYSNDDSEKMIHFRELYAEGFNKKNTSPHSVFLSLEGTQREILVHTSIYLDEKSVKSILSSDKLTKLYIKYQYTTLKFTTGAPNTVWVAKLTETGYILISSPK